MLCHKTMKLVWTKKWEPRRQNDIIAILILFLHINWVSRPDDFLWRQRQNGGDTLFYGREMIEALNFAQFSGPGAGGGGDFCKSSGSGNHFILGFLPLFPPIYLSIYCIERLKWNSFLEYGMCICCRRSGHITSKGQG